MINQDHRHQLVCLGFDFNCGHIKREMAHPRSAIYGISALFLAEDRLKRCDWMPNFSMREKIIKSVQRKTEPKTEAVHCTVLTFKIKRWSLLWTLFPQKLKVAAGGIFLYTYLFIFFYRIFYFSWILTGFRYTLSTLYTNRTADFLLSKKCCTKKDD